MKLTAEAFSATAKSLFLGRLDLSRIDYFDAKTPVTLGCPDHGWFEWSPLNVLRSMNGCPTCDQVEAATSSDPKAVARRAKENEQQRARRALSPERSRGWQRDYYWRNRETPHVRARTACHALLTRVIRHVREGGTTDATREVGYSVEEFKTHIEAQFESWMGWANHGEWHIDHIVPMSWYLEQGITDPKVINALSNLRPIKAIDNLTKSSKLIPEAIEKLKQQP